MPITRDPTNDHPATNPSEPRPDKIGNCERRTEGLICARLLRISSFFFIIIIFVPAYPPGRDSEKRNEVICETVSRSRWIAGDNTQKSTRLLPLPTTSFLRAPHFRLERCAAPNEKWKKKKKHRDERNSHDIFMWALFLMPFLTRNGSAFLMCHRFSVLIRWFFTKIYIRVSVNYLILNNL